MRVLALLRGGWTPAVAALGLVALWLVDVGAAGLPAWLVRSAATACLGVLALWLLDRALGATRDRSPGGDIRRWAWALFGVALVVRLVGLDFELIDHPRNDEGVYLEVARRINEGELLPGTFNYGHFLYYGAALALWLGEILPESAIDLARWTYGLETAEEVEGLLARAVNALLAAATTPAVFVVGLRIAGLAAGVLSGLLITFSPLYNDVAHELIADVPAGAFAALTLVFVSRLVDRESLRDYLLAGVAAGLAAGSKYPGGVAAVAIVAVWVYWRLKLRRWSWSLAAAAVTAIGSMLAVMPALVLRPEGAFAGRDLDIFFGFRQYAFGGWLGVQPASAAGWYGERLLRSFGAPALLLGLGGIFWLGAEARRRWLLLLPFPLVYLTLIGSMSMVVRRNLQPALPIVAALLGAGLAGWHELARGRRRPWAPTVLVVTGLVALALPAWRTLSWEVAHSRPGTRQLARSWLAEHVPDGISILRESYTSVLDPERYDIHFLRFAAWLPLEQLRTPRFDYLLLATTAHGRFLNPEALTRDHEREFADRYRRMLAELELVEEWRPGALRAGAHLLLLRVTPERIDHLTERRFAAADATWVSDPPLRRLGDGQPLQFTRRWQYAVFKDFFEAGRYRVELETDRRPEEGYLYAVTPDNEEIGTWEIVDAVEIELGTRGKVLFRVFLPPPTRLYGWSLRRSAEPPVGATRRAPARAERAASSVR